MAPHKIICRECGRTIEDQYLDTCPSCGGLLVIKMDLEPLKAMRPKDLHKVPIGVWRYAPFLPADPSAKVSIQEGGTPLYKCSALGNEIGIGDLHVKYEGANPTGSFKDRGMTVGVSHAMEIGAKIVGCASTGNTSASLAAYAAKAGLKCAVFLPSGKVAAGKLAQAMFFGATVLSVDGNFDEALRIVRELAKERHLYLLNSINPYRPEGQKSVLFEIMDQLSYEVPDRIILPVGNAGNISAVHKAIMELEEIGWISKVPMLTGIQAEGSMPIVRAFNSKHDDFIPEENPETIATAIRIGNPVSGRKALKAIYDTGGHATSVTDEEIIAAQKLLGRKEGVGVEPASAASVAGAKKLVEMGVIDKKEKVVCICTGNALKDPDTIISTNQSPIRVSKGLLGIKNILGL
ncbi:MAG: threonine synthase [Methanomassiliicoccaceae archaeon]|jgi:threonine synthase|nr:threonine synthase [Methanomassiliicoccaceae archaeon]